MKCSCTAILTLLTQHGGCMQGGPGEIFEKCSGRLTVGIGHVRDVLACNWNHEKKVCVVDYS